MHAIGLSSTNRLYPRVTRVSDTVSPGGVHCRLLRALDPFNLQHLEFLSDQEEWEVLKSLPLRTRDERWRVGHVNKARGPGACEEVLLITLRGQPRGMALCNRCIGC